MDKGDSNMRIEFHAPRCPDCDENMSWNKDFEARCKWCAALGKPEDGES